MKLALPENKAQRELCERAKAFLDNDYSGEVELPSQVIEKDGYVQVWFIYEDAWLGDDSPNFSYSLSIPTYAIWGRKKREKYLKTAREEYQKRVSDLEEKLKQYPSRRVS